MIQFDIRPAEVFPEPEFSRLRRSVFFDIEAYSETIEAVIHTEAEAFPASAPTPSKSYSPTLRLGAYVGDEMIGWSFGWLERGRSFYMASSGVVANYRRQGVYTALLTSVCDSARSMGAVMVRSQHSVLNNAVIISKLRSGFQISGLSQSAQLGALAELTLHLSNPRAELFRSRVIPLTAERDAA